MGFWEQIAVADFRNDDWSLFGSGVFNVFEAWNNDDDTKYCQNPANKGRVAVTFPVNPTDLPLGAVITNVSIYIRAERANSTEQAVTCNVMAKDDTSRYTTRTIYLSDTPTDYEVASYTLDPLNLPWDIFRINQLIAQCWVYAFVADIVRIYKCWFRVEYHTRPTIKVIGPSGNQGTSSPLIEWTYEQEDGDLQDHIDYKIYKRSNTLDASFDPDQTGPLFEGRKVGDLRQFILPHALPPGNYIIYLRAESEFGCHSAWESKSFTVLAPVPGIPAVTATANDAKSSIELTAQDTSNILTAGKANWEVFDDDLEYVANNCTVVRDTDTALPSIGEASFQLTASTAATMDITSPYVDVAELQDFTMRAHFHSDANDRTVNMVASFFDVNYNSVGTAVTATGTDTTDWIVIDATGTTPEDTSFVTLKLEVVSPADAEVHNVDGIGFMYGTGVPWTDGGHLSYNILSSDYSSNPGLGTWTVPSTTSTSSITPTGTGARGPNALRLTLQSATGDISFVAVGAADTSSSEVHSVTLDVPTGTSDNDTMIAIVTAHDNNQDITDIDPPDGWSLINSVNAEHLAQFMLYRLAGPSEPSSYTATLPLDATFAAQVVTYRGVHTTNPFIDEGVAAYTVDSSESFDTPVLSNTVEGAWRVTASSTDDNDTTAATYTMSETVEGGISYVGKSPTWGTENGSATSYTLYEPGASSGDLMLAFLSLRDDNTGTTETSPPSGWTQIADISSTDNINNDDQYMNRLVVMQKIHDGTEPSSWSGSLSLAHDDLIITQVFAYRSVDTSNPIVVDGVSQEGGDPEASWIQTATVDNPDSRNWRVTAFASGTGFLNDDWEIYSGGTERTDTSIIESDNDAAWTLAVYDSDGPISAGNTYKWASMDEFFSMAVSWIGILKVDPSVPASSADETERFENSGIDGTVGHALADSNGTVIGIKNQKITTTQDSDDYATALTWMGILRPGSATSDVLRATQTNHSDISLVDPKVLGFAESKVTLTAHFKGSVAGVPYLKVNFYRANQLLEDAIAIGNSYDSTLWTRSSATFNLPPGTTHMAVEFYSPDREVDDTLDIDAICLKFGSTPGFYRGGSARYAHPIWAIPTIEYADEQFNGRLIWQELPGIIPRPPVYKLPSGKSTYTDLYPTPLTARHYRVYTKTYGLNGDIFASNFSEEAVATVVAENWWLKDVIDPTNNMILRVQAESWEQVTTNTAEAFQPLGSQYPIVLTDGYKADRVELTILMQKEEWSKFERLMRLNRTYFLQSDQDVTWWVRPVGDLSAETIVSANRNADPYRWVTQQFVEIRPVL